MESIITFVENNNILVRGILILLGYLITFVLTTYLVKKIVIKKNVKLAPAEDENVNKVNSKTIRDGRIIGKCENVIILTFVLVGEITGLALIFAAKNLARQKDINDNAGFFLAGTMVNFTTTLIIAYILKLILAGLPH